MDEQASHHPHEPHDSFDGGDLDCGNGLLLLIRKHIDPLTPGQLLEILSTETSVVEDLPAWCRLTGNESGLSHQPGQAEQLPGFKRSGCRTSAPRNPSRRFLQKRKKRRGNTVQRAKRNTHRLPSPSPRS